MKSYNEDFYLLFNEIADLMAILSENPFKIRAYREAARRLKEDMHPIYKKDASEAAFKKLPGIGEAIAMKMMQYIDTGNIKLLEQLRAQVPKPVRDLLNVPHLGPNRVRDLYIHLGIKSKKDLVKAAKEGKIEALPGFGEKLVESILGAIERGQAKKKRHDRGAVEPIAKRIIGILAQMKKVKSAEAAGSFRRGEKTIGDLDILVTGDLDNEKTEAAIRKEFGEISILGSGETKISFVIFPDNLQVDIRFLPQESYGAALLYFTGSKDFNVMMRKRAIERGFLLNEYGLFKAGEYVAGETEEVVFEQLDMKYVEPKKRK
ncbi:MAG: helix-hairpin-helix domain-containing protein [Candidatus Peregrinibacteria bacterium]|nr:helix-hairpin-helix domain-containing protein [Candidatus Peregrinibacteria bacterium]